VTTMDTATPSITGTSASITVSAAALDHFGVAAPASATAGTAFTLTFRPVPRRAKDWKHGYGHERS
jgi:hypothetical protein